MDSIGKRGFQVRNEGRFQPRRTGFEYQSVQTKGFQARNGFQSWGFQIRERRGFQSRDDAARSQAKGNDRVCWSPVLNNHWKLNDGGDLTTLFVDNLPIDINNVWVRNLFSKFGRVRDLFIPKKISRNTGQRFGFVRFARKNEANMAIVKVNGQWIWNQRLVVKIARFDGNNRSSNQEDSQAARMVERNRQPIIHVPQSKYLDTKGKVLKRKSEVWKQTRIANEVKTGKAERDQRKSYLNALKGNTSSNVRKPIGLREVGNEWLHRSAIAKLSPVRSMALVQDHLKSLGYADIQVRIMGGDYVVLTFACSSDRDSMFNGGKFSWLKEWFTESHKWERYTIKPPHCRIVWLNLYGVPIHLWSCVNFINLGQIWGEVINVADETAKCLSFDVGKVLINTSRMDIINEVMEVENRGEIYKVRVIEEQMVINTFLKADCTCLGCQIQNSSFPQSKAVEEDEEKNDGVNRNMGKNGVEKNDVKDNMSKTNEVANSAGEGAGDNMNDVVGDSVLQEVVGDSIDVVESINRGNKLVVAVECVSKSLLEQSKYGGGLKKSIDANSTWCLGHNLGQKPMVAQVMCPNVIEPAIIAPSSSRDNDSNWSIVPYNRNVISKQTRRNEKLKKASKGKRKQKTIEEILGLSKTNGVKRGGKRGKQKCVVFRSAVAAAALSVSSEGINNRNRILLNEAQAVWTVAKIMGEDYMGNDDEVISKIMVMEEQDEDRYAQMNNELA